MVWFLWRWSDHFIHTPYTSTLRCTTQINTSSSAFQYFIMCTTCIMSYTSTGVINHVCHSKTGHSLPFPARKFVFNFLSPPHLESRQRHDAPIYPGSFQQHLFPPSDWLLFDSMSMIMGTRAILSCHCDIVQWFTNRSVLSNKSTSVQCSIKHKGVYSYGWGDDGVKGRWGGDEAIKPWFKQNLDVVFGGKRPIVTTRWTQCGIMASRDSSAHHTPSATQTKTRFLLL